MKSIKVTEPFKIEICDVEKPEIRTGKEVLVKVKAAGVCGSDMHIYHGTSPVATYPRVIGHEVVGIVEEIGEDVSKIKSGDHVIVDPVVSCGKCYACKIGRQNVCSSLKVRGVHEDGGYREFMVVPEDSLHVLSKDLPWEEAVMIEPFTIGAQVCSRGELTKDDTVFIMGAGPVGQCVLQVAKKIGAKCIISDLTESRLEKARKLGADLVINAGIEDVKEIIMKETNNEGVPVVIDAVCTTASFENAFDYVTTAGRILVLGLNKKPSQIAQLNIMAKELDVRGSRLHNNKFPEVVKWFNNREIVAKDMISHVFQFTDIYKAIELIENSSIENQKVILKFDY
ncbi:zinc-binding alcohol dehydrogenase family protein [Wukongibacter sp. M2B1]|uniref:zinc-binding alcohol dehydrogenase family protein n=1 Tax=Wukongibacter sp. M2B1 TaxID=3088895 RepID=UPI003D7B1C8D